MIQWLAVIRKSLCRRGGAIRECQGPRRGGRDECEEEQCGEGARDHGEAFGFVEV